MKKKLFYALVFFTSITLTSCDSDDDSNSSNDPIIGNWNVIELGYSYEDIVTGDTGEEVLDATICNPNPTMTFNENGNATLTDMEFDEDIEDNITCEVFGTLNGEWVEINDNVYAITVDGETSQVTIEFSNSNNNLKMIIEEQDEDEIYEDYIKLERQ